MIFKKFTKWIVVFIPITFLGILSGCGPSAKMAQKGETTIDNLRLVYDEDRAEARQQAVTVSNDGKMIAFAYDNGIIKIVDLTTGRKVKKMKLRYQDLVEIRYNFDNSKLLVIENDNNVRVLDIETDKIHSSFNLPDKIQKISVSKNSDFVAFGLNDGRVLVFDLATNKKLQEFTTKKKIGSLAFHPNGKEVAFAPIGAASIIMKRPIFIYDIETGRQIEKIDRKIYTAITYSEEGDRLYIAGYKHNFTTDTFFEYYDFNTGKTSRINKKANFGFSSKMYFSINVFEESILATTNENEFEVIGIANGESIYKTNRGRVRLTLLNSSNTGAKRIYPLYDGKSFLINYTDNNINEIYNAETNKITAYLYSDANDDFAVVSRDGRMEGNQEAISNVAWSKRKSIKRVPLEATFDRYYTPNLLQSLLSDDFEYAEAEEKNLEKAIELAPDVEITRPGSIFTADQSKVQIEVSATSNGDPVKEIQISVNGKPIGENQRGLKVAGNRRTAEVELIPGRSTISAVAVTEQGYRSRPDRVQVNYEGPTAESNLYVLAVGIDEYQNNSYNLNYATTDAGAFVEEVRSKAGSIFDDIQVSNISDGEATKKKVEQAINSIRQKARPQDMFVFYYAGHGVMSEGNSSASGDFYLALHDVTQLYGSDQMLADRGISAAELREAFGDIEARKQLIVLDACQSGGAVETFAMRGAAEEKAMIQLARSTGITLLASTGTEQFATEFEQLGHGVFTYSILEGLSGKADGGSRDGKITVKELEAYLNDTVPELTQEYKGTVQYPRSWSHGMDFPVVVVE